MRIEITGSKAHRVWKCPSSAVLPQVAEDETIHEPARNKGKGIHGYLEVVGEVGAIVAQAGVGEDLLPLVKAIDLDDVPVGLSTEVAFAWNWRTNTARELGRNINRCYELADPPVDPDSEIALTMDLIGVQGRRGYCGDYKSGHGKYPAPDMFGQTLLGACCARSVFDLDECVVELIHIHDDGDNHKSRRLLDEWDMDAFAREFQRSMLQVERWEREYERTGQVGAIEGPWCQYCPAFMACPAKVALIHAIPAELMAFGAAPNAETGALELREGVISVRNAADVWMMLERISDIVSKAKAQVRGIAFFEDVELPDGRVLGKQVTERRHLNAEIAAQVIEKRYGRAERDARVKISMSLDAVHQAVVNHIKPGQKIHTKKNDGVLDLVLGEIDQLGGMETKVTAPIKAYAPKRLK